jgi:DNA-binding NarL/FixJ family response regulator
MGFSTIILGLPSASFAVDVVHLLMRESRHLHEFESPDGEQQVLGLKLRAEEREASLVPADLCFTRRETALVDLLRRGMQNKIMAYKLGISESTVKSHLRSIMKKLKAKNRTQAVCILAQDVEHASKESMHG